MNACHFEKKTLQTYHACCVSPYTYEVPIILLKKIMGAAIRATVSYIFVQFPIIQLIKLTGATTRAINDLV